MDFKNEKITILYGSQTGNSQDIAEQIWRDSKRFYFNGGVKSMDDYYIQDIVNEKCIIFVCSTTGQGEEPDNMKQFWKFLLRKNLPQNFLLHLRFGVLGLGDSSYVKFNFVAKRLNKRLIQLGAEPLVSLGLADDQHDLGYDAVVDPWSGSLWNNLLVSYPLPSGVNPLERMKLEPRWTVTSSIGATRGVHHNALAQYSIYDAVRTQGEFNTTIKDIIRTTHPTHFQDVRLIKLQTDGQRYLPGDVVVIRPKNSPAEVEEFLTALKSNGVNIPTTTIFKIGKKSSEMPVPDVLQQEVSFGKLCEEYFDLNCVPRRNTFAILAQLTDSELEKEKLLEFLTAEGQNDLYNYCNRPKRNIVEVLQDFPHATKNITQEVLFELLPAMKPREFSIASNFNAHTNEIHILLAVVKYKTKLVKERLGLCSNYLANLQVTDELTVWLKKGSFRFPNKDVPVIMVGPGTGMAPFRNFIYEAVTQNFANSENLVFFFGCRGEKMDFHCKEDLEMLQKQNKLTLINAFSRDQESKIYVQHKITENGKLVWNLLKNNTAFIFIAGNSKNMPQQVREAFVSVCQDFGKMSQDEAVDFINTMERRGQYQTETWS